MITGVCVLILTVLWHFFNPAPAAKEEHHLGSFHAQQASYTNMYEIHRALGDLRGRVAELEKLPSTAVHAQDVPLIKLMLPQCVQPTTEQIEKCPGLAVLAQAISPSRPNAALFQPTKLTLIFLEQNDAKSLSTPATGQHAVTSEASFIPAP